MIFLSKAAPSNITSTALYLNNSIDIFPSNLTALAGEYTTYYDIMEPHKNIMEKYESNKSLRGGGYNVLLGGSNMEKWYNIISSRTIFDPHGALK